MKLRGNRTFFEFSENAELSARASLCPLRFGVDAIILFYDITTLAVAMGQKFELVTDRGPVPHEPIRTLADVERLTDRCDPQSYRHVLDMLNIVRGELPAEIPILVFAGAPFTLATYQIATGKNVSATREFIAENPKVWHALLEKTATATVGFLDELLQAGAAAYQIFDSWAGSLTAAEYREFADVHHRSIFRDVGGISILFVKDNPFVDMAASSGATILSLGKHDDLHSLQTKYPHLVFQGNVDHELLIHGTPAEVRTATQKCLQAGGGRRHIVNLDHGMDRDARVENFEAFVAAAKQA